MTTDDYIKSKSIIGCRLIKNNSNELLWTYYS